MAKHAKDAPENRPPEGRRFQKGKSGNPGGRPKGAADFQRMVLERIPKALEVADKLLDSAEDKVRASVINTLLSRGLPVPKHGDEFDKPLPLTVDPAQLTTLGMVSDARLLLATEIERLKVVSAAGIPLSEAATIRLTEVVKQLGLLADHEKKFKEADPFANQTTEELEKAYEESKRAEPH